MSWDLKNSLEMGQSDIPTYQRCPRMSRDLKDSLDMGF